MASLSRVPKVRARPEPVSCRSCRSKKLKCNRVEPCSNCTARGIACKFLVPPNGRADTTPTVESNAELSRRIERLESLLLRKTVTSGPHLSHTIDTTLVTKQPKSFEKSSGGEFAAKVHYQRDEDSRVLGNIGTREDSLVCGLSHQKLMSLIIL